MKAAWIISAILVTSACSSSAPPPPARACAPPRAYWHRPYNFVGLSPPIFLVGVDAGGAIYWNGDRIDAHRFAANLARAHKFNPEPEIYLEIEAGAPCGAIESVRDEMDRRLECRQSGMCEEGVRSIWEGVPTPPGTAIS